MLFRKMHRELKMHFGQFFSIFLLALLAMMIYVTFEGHVLSEEIARETFHEECNLSDLWVYGEGFSKEQLETVRKLDFVKDAQLRTQIRGTAPDCDDAQVDIYMMDEECVNKGYVIDGEAFEAEAADGVWLTNAFAEKRDIKVGDEFKIAYSGITFTRTVKGLIETPEYEYRQADGDADVYIENIAFVYMPYEAFPTDDYIWHMLTTGKFSLGNIGDMQTSSQMIPATEMVIVTKDGGALKHEDEIAEALDNDYSAIIDESSVQGLARFDSELEQHQSFSYIFALIFVGVAVLVIATSMSRMVEKQRTQIGTMNAMGMKRGKILIHYVSFSILPSALGAIAGMLIGVFVGAPYMLEIFGGYYIVPKRTSGFHPIYLVLIAVIVGICALAAYMSCRRILKIQPAEALRPAMPKSGKKCIFERLPFWEKLSFTVQYNLRDISRGKMRTFMCIVGTAFGMLLMVYGTACNGLLGDMESIAFDRITPAEYQVKLSEDAKLSDLDRLSKSMDGELVMADALEVSKVENAKSDEKKKGTITVLEGKGLYNILDLDNEVTSTPPGTVALSRKFAEELHVSVGDIIYWHLYTKNEWHEAKVGVIYRSSESQGITMLRKDFEESGETFAPTLMMTNTKDDALKEREDVVAVNSKADMKKAFETSMEIVNVLVYLMIVFSAILIIVVLYNSGSLSFNERVKELATLKVLGFQSSKIRRMMSIQNLWLSAIGIILGAPFGKMTFNSMMNSNGENFDYNLSIHGAAYIEAGVFVLIVSVLVSFLFSKRIKRLDMVEALKGVE